MRLSSSQSLRSPPADAPAPTTARWRSLLCARDGTWRESASTGYSGRPTRPCRSQVAQRPPSDRVQAKTPNCLGSPVPVTGCRCDRSADTRCCVDFYYSIHLTFAAVLNFGRVGQHGDDSANRGRSLAAALKIWVPRSSDPPRADQSMAPRSRSHRDECAPLRDLGASRWTAQPRCRSLAPRPFRIAHCSLLRGRVECFNANDHTSPVEFLVPTWVPRNTPQARSTIPLTLLLSSAAAGSGGELAAAFERPAECQLVGVLEVATHR